MDPASLSFRKRKHGATPLGVSKGTVCAGVQCSDYCLPDQSHPGNTMHPRHPSAGGDVTFLSDPRTKSTHNIKAVSPENLIV